MNIPSIRSIPILALVLAILLGLAVGQASAQTTQFTYQGQLAETGVAANGSYDFQFALFDDPTGPNQLGSTISTSGVTVNGGIFTVNLDFGAQFSGPARYLQISVKQSANPGAYTVLHPRQPITSAPYSVRSLNATAADTATSSAQLGGVPASQYVQTGDTRLSDQRDPLSGSSSYIQSNPPIQQVGTFNINGTGSASTFNAAAQYDIAGVRMLSAPGTNNIFGGNGTGTANTSGAGNAFVGFNAGHANSSGSFNSFFGANAGAANTTAINDAFFGQAAGFKNTTGHDNTFVGNGAGLNTVAGSSNTFVGSLAGQGNNGGANNTFMGVNAGTSNIGSSNNTFVGANAANSNLTGSGNTYLGANTDGALLISNATAIGQNAFVGQSDSVVIGSVNGANGAAVNASVGIGTTTPAAQLNIVDPIVGTEGSYPLLIESENYIVGLQMRSNYFAGNAHLFGIRVDTNGNGSGEMDFTDSASGTVPMALSTGPSASSQLTIDGVIALDLHAGGHQSICLNNGGTFGIISTCSSSLRYKKDIDRFSPGLALINKLHPISFRWKSDNEKDLGFGAEDVAKAEPLLVTHNAKGEVEGVKYDRITAVLVNAVKEQQAQIDSLQKIVMQQRYHASHATTQAIVSLKYQVATLQAQRRRRAIRVPMAKPAATVANIPAALPGQAVILKSPDGATCKALSIDNTGAMVLASVPCP